MAGRPRRDEAGCGAAPGGATVVRWAAGRIGESWDDVTSAFEQVRRAAPSSDFLNLNIWTPEPGPSGLPVMVWIQGGMFELSSTAAYDGRTVRT